MSAPAIASRFGIGWQDLHNRHEKLSVDPHTGGRICHWKDSSSLTAFRFFPRLGARFLQFCLRRWPVNFTTTNCGMSFKPEVSFVVGVRGTKRLPQFQATVASLLGQLECATETIVVEQSFQQEFSSIIPSGARYIHTATFSADVPYNRSWALNVGAREARGRILILHDGDYVVPAHFAREVARRMTDGVESLRLARYIFYLDQDASERVQRERTWEDIRGVSQIVQNNPTPIGLTRDAYFRIGGHDESFYGWGGEDNEFLDRARTLHHREGAFLPVIHLWHPEAPNRRGDRNSDRLQQILSVAPSIRIQYLTSRDFGRASPSIAWPSLSQNDCSSTTSDNPSG